MNANGYPTLHEKGYVPPVSSSSSSAVSTTNTPGCGDVSPENAPDLFQISPKGSSATLYFVPVSGHHSGYMIAYGLTDSAESYGVEFAHQDVSGAIPYTVNSLFPGTWYFKVRGQNGCRPGEWSSAKTVVIPSR